MFHNISHFVDHQKLIENKKLNQVEISKKKGCSSPHDFQSGDKVVIQDNVSKCWNIPGDITERCIAEDGTSRRFLVEKEGVYRKIDVLLCISFMDPKLFVPIIRQTLTE